MEQRSGTKENETEEFITYRAASRLTDLWQKEDYWAIWLGMIVIVLAIMKSGAIFTVRLPEVIQGNESDEPEADPGETESANAARGGELQ